VDLLRIASADSRATSLRRRGEPWCCGHHVRSDMRFELLEIPAEHLHELYRLRVVGGGVRPRLAWIEDLRVDPGHRDRHLEAETRIGAHLRRLERAMERRREKRARHLDRHA